MSVLLDANVLIAAALDAHEHHAPVDRWLSEQSEKLATCPITEGALIREVVRGGERIEVALELLRQVKSQSRHEFWSDDISYVDMRTSGVIGHKQVTDAYLAQLARAHTGRLATLDRPLASLHSDVVDLVPTS